MQRLLLILGFALVACSAPQDPEATELRNILRETMNTFQESREKIGSSQTDAELFSVMKDFTQKIEQLAQRKRAVLGPGGSLSPERLKRLRMQLQPDVEAFQAEILRMHDTVTKSRWNNKTTWKNPKFRQLKTRLFAALTDLSRNDEVP